MQKIKSGDTVQVISGNEIGFRGEVERVIRGWRKKGENVRTERNPDLDRLIIRGVNIRKKHQKRTGQTRTQTGIIELEAPVHVSNVMLVCPSCDEAVRVGFVFEGGKKARFCKRCKAIVDKV